MGDRGRTKVNDTALNTATMPPTTTSPLKLTDREHPPPEVWDAVLERKHFYLVHAAASTSPQQNGPWVLRGPDTMPAPGSTPPGAVWEPTTPNKVLRGVLHTGDHGPVHTTPPRALAQITSREAGYHVGLAMFCPSQWSRRRWPATGATP